jgi:ABC-type antimicrobial peptide transport system permease subunit
MLAVKLSADGKVDEVKQNVGNYGELRVSSNYQMQVFQEERSRSPAQRQAEARKMSEEQLLEERAKNLVPEKLADDFSQQPEILTYDKVLEARINVSGITNPAIASMLSLRQGRGEQATEGVGGLSSNSFYFEGNTAGVSASDFLVGNKVLTEGHFYTYDDYLKANPVVIVEENLAVDNGLKLGDTITALINGKSGKEAEVKLKIIGVYRTVQAEQQGEGETFNPAGSTFYSPLSVVQKLNNTPGYVELGSYYFDSVDSTERLQQAFNAEIGADNDKYEFATDYSDYEKIAEPLQKVSKTSVIGLGGALGACVLIIFLAMAIAMGARTKELGVLKAIGATDRQVIAQYAAEVICICLVSIILAMGITALVSQKMGNWLLSGSKATTVEGNQQEGQVQGARAQSLRNLIGNNKLYKEGGRFSLTASNQEQSVSLRVVYRGSLFLYSILILLGVSLLGMAIPVIWITRLRPARVLTIE